MNDAYLKDIFMNKILNNEIKKFEFRILTFKQKEENEMDIVEIIVDIQDLKPFIIISSESKIIKFGWKQDRYITENRPQEYHFMQLGNGINKEIKTKIE